VPTDHLQWDTGDRGGVRLHRVEAGEGADVAGEDVAAAISVTGHVRTADRGVARRVGAPRDHPCRDLRREHPHAAEAEGEVEVEVVGEAAGEAMAEGNHHHGEAAVAGEVEEVRATTRTAVLVRGTAVEAESGDEVVLNIITCRVVSCFVHGTMDGSFQMTSALCCLSR
jgi:hypothetical protein